MTFEEYDNNFLTLRNNVAYLESHCIQNASTFCQETVKGIEKYMDNIGTHDIVIRSKRNSREKRAVGVVLASVLGLAAGAVATKVFDKATNNNDDQWKTELINNQISMVETIEEEILESLITFHARQKTILEMLENKNAKLRPNWIKPIIIEEEIQVMQSHLGDDLNLIGEKLENKMAHVYQVAQTSAFMEKNA